MKPIYLTLHFRETLKTIAAFISAYNKQLLADNPTGYRALRIKSPVEQTIGVLLKAYSKFLHTNAQQGLTNPVFKINRKAIATMLHNRRSESTIWRHIKAATRAGVLDKNMYVFHGSNSSFELGFNSSLLVACQSEEYTNLLTNIYKSNVNNPPIPVNISVDMRASRPSFTDAFNGCMLSFCYHIVPVKTLQEQNINMDKVENVDKSKVTLLQAHVQTDCTGPSAWSFALVNIPGEPPIASAIDRNKNIEQEQGSWNTHSAKMVVDAAIKRLEARTKQEQVAPAKIENVAPKRSNEDLRFFTDAAINIALRVLFAGKVYDDEDIFTAKQHIRKYLSSPDKKLGQLFNTFQLVIYEANKSRSRKHYNPAPIYKYFDSHFNGGFYKSLTHVEEVVIPFLYKNADAKKSMSDTIMLINQHLKNPNDFESYRKAAQYLGKKKNKGYLNFYNTTVANQQSLNSSSIQQLYTQAIQQ